MVEPDICASRPGCSTVETDDPQRARQRTARRDLANGIYVELSRWRGERNGTRERGIRRDQEGDQKNGVPQRQD